MIYLAKVRKILIVSLCFLQSNYILRVKYSRCIPIFMLCSFCRTFLATYFTSVYNVIFMSGIESVNDIRVFYICHFSESCYYATCD